MVIGKVQVFTQSTTLQNEYTCERGPDSRA